MSTRAMIYQNISNRENQNLTEHLHCRNAADHNSYRRSRTVKRRRYVHLHLAMASLLILTVLTFLGCSVIRSNAADSNMTYKYYTSIRIEEGDSLWSIADKYHTAEYESREEYMQELAEVNQLTDATLHAGQYLMVPYYSSEYK